MPAVLCCAVLSPARLHRFRFVPVVVSRSPASTGRNFTEVLRVIDSLQLAVSSKVATPVDWNKGQKVVILPAVPDDEVSARLLRWFPALPRVLNGLCGASVPRLASCTPSSPSCRPRASCA